MNRLNYYIINSDCDAVLLYNATDMRYNTGYVPDWGYYLYVGSGNYLLTDGRFVLEAKACLSDDYTIIEVNSTEVFERIRKILSENNARSVGFNSDMSHNDYIKFTAELRGYDLHDISTDIVKARLTKDRDELSYIIKAQRIAERSLRELIIGGDIKVGVTESELAAKLEYLIRINGGEKVSFDSIVAFGANSAFAHAKPGNNRLKFGDIMLFDFGAKYKGYCSDMTRTFVYGEVNDRVAAMYAAVLEANIAGCNAINAGISSREPDRLAREVLAKHNLEKYFNHSLGHGVGIEIHEEPRLSLVGDATTLAVNSVITVEPGVYVEHLGGIRIEDMVIVTADGGYNITEFDKNLVIID